MSFSPQLALLDQDHQQFVEDMKNGQNNIMVVVRTRPLNQKELMKSDYETINVLDQRVVVMRDPGYEMNLDDVLRKNRNKEMQFAFDYAFDKDVDQPAVYQNSAQFLIQGVYEGFNGTVFAYGATGAGKTYTMIGTADNPGIMERSINDLFTKYDELKLTKDIILRVSYIEIYNEQIKDILTSRDKNLDLREDPSQGVVVNGITEIDVKNTQEVLHLLKIGNKNRTVESTGANEISSRSHAVLQIQLQVKDKAGGIHEEIQYSKLSLVDLAGSERASNTQNRGIRLIEGAKINQSLLVLGNCIQALSEASEKGIKHPFVQYRGSKLTRLLKDSLGGNCRTVMIANISAYINSFEDTYNTLNYANRAKNIKTQVSRNYLNVDNHISNYTHLIDNLKKENQNLKKLLQNRSMTIPSDDLIHYEDENKSQETMKSIELKIAEHFKEELELERKIFKLDEKLQEAQFEQFNLLSDSKKKQESQNDIVKYKELLQENNQLINTLQKSKNDVEKKLSNVLQNRQSFLKMISQEDMNQTDRNYLNSIFQQNKLIIENAQIQYQEKKQEALNMHRQLQIQFLKDQVKIRDEIINNQKQILNKNQIVHRASYEPLVEMNDIEAQISPANNHDYSFLTAQGNNQNIKKSPKFDRLRSYSRNVPSINQSPKRSTEKIQSNDLILPQIGNSNVRKINNTINRSQQRQITNHPVDQSETSMYSLYGSIPNINYNHDSQMTSQRNKIDYKNNFIPFLDHNNSHQIRSRDQQSQKSVSRKIDHQKSFFERSNSRKKINYYESNKKEDIYYNKQRTHSKYINQSFNEGLNQSRLNHPSQKLSHEPNDQINSNNKYSQRQSDKININNNSHSQNNNNNNNQMNINSNNKNYNKIRVVAYPTENSPQNYNKDIVSLNGIQRKQSEDIHNKSFRSTSSSIFSNSSHLNINTQKTSNQSNKNQIPPSSNSNSNGQSQQNKLLNFLNNDLRIKNLSKTEVSRQQINKSSINTGIKKSQNNNNKQNIDKDELNIKDNNNEKLKSYSILNTSENNNNNEQRAERLRQLNINIKYLKDHDSQKIKSNQMTRDSTNIKERNDLSNNNNQDKSNISDKNNNNNNKSNHQLHVQPKKQQYQYQQFVEDQKLYKKQQSSQEQSLSKLISSNNNNNNILPYKNGISNKKKIIL